MSYDMNIGTEEYGFTYNCSKMFYRCFPLQGIRTHYGLTGKQAIPILKKLQWYMINHNQSLKLLNPANGYGDFDSALAFVTKLLIASVNNPDEIWEGD